MSGRHAGEGAGAGLEDLFPGGLPSAVPAAPRDDDRDFFVGDDRRAASTAVAVSIERIGTDLKLEAGGARRTLRLTNPGLEYGTTPTFWASIQYILPGEIATSHRHAATALRFIMDGEGADTTVDGESYEMNKGDLVLTPSWSFHDHEHKGSTPMVWLDVLDITLVRKLEAVFFEPSDLPRRPVDGEHAAGGEEIVGQLATAIDLLLLFQQAVVYQQALVRAVVVQFVERVLDLAARDVDAEVIAGLVGRAGGKFDVDVACGAR